MIHVLMVPRKLIACRGRIESLLIGCPEEIKIACNFSLERTRTPMLDILSTLTIAVSNVWTYTIQVMSSSPWFGVQGRTRRNMWEQLRGALVDK